MQLGIIGLPLVGKTTIFELLTESKTAGLNNLKTNTAMARIPDARINYLSGLFNPRKTTYAQLEVVDIPGLVPGGEKTTGVFLDAVRRADALLHVVRLFSDNHSAAMDDLNPVRDIESIHYELLLADLMMLEKRIERIEENKKKKASMGNELDLLHKIKEALENEIPLSTIPVQAEEMEILQTYQFLTDKPVLICLNIKEDDLITGQYPGRDDLISYLQEKQLAYVEVSAEIEKEINELDGEEKEVFMQDMGLAESGVVRIARTVYHSLGLISFFTVGEDEVKAWTIYEGTPARKAAGKIHSDIERGFIRAEVVAYDELKHLGSMSAVREKGLFRLEGKEYVVKDGDIVHFRFNV